MGKPLRVLLVEDSERDAALLKLFLRRGGYDADVHRVETRAELNAKLEDGAFDLVVSDFNLPAFDAFAARKAVQESGRDLPFIVLSGDFSPSMIDELTAANIRHLRKDELRDLGALIEDAMRERS